MENQDIRVSTQWEHSITNLLGHAPTTEPGIALRQWVLHQGVENNLDLLSWEEEEVKDNRTQQVFPLDEHGQGSYLRTNQTKQLCGLITYMKHIFNEYMSTGVRPDPFYPFSPEEWSHKTSTMMRTYLVQNLPTPIGPRQNSSQKEPCLTLTLMVERQDTNPNTTLNGYIMEFWRFDLTWKLKCPMQQK